MVILNEDCPSFIDYLLNQKCSLKSVQELNEFKKTDSPLKFKRLELYTKEKFLDKVLNLFECTEVLVWNVILFSNHNNKIYFKLFPKGHVG